MLTEKQDKAIFRAVFDFYCRNKKNGADREKWLRCAEEAKGLCEQYQGVQLLETLIKGVYAQLIADCSDKDGQRS